LGLLCFRLFLRGSIGWGSKGSPWFPKNTTLLERTQGRHQASPEDVAENHGVTGLSVIKNHDLAYSILCSAARLVDKHTTLASGKHDYSYHVKDSAGELTAEVKTWWYTLDIPFSAVVLGDKDDDDHHIFEDFCLEVNAPSDSRQKTINNILQENGILQTSQKVRISFGD
jgi:hypothetical protein